MSGLAPENYCCFSSTQQSPQNIYEQYKTISYSYFNFFFPFFFYHSKYSLSSLTNSLRTNLLNPLIANISPCRSYNKLPLWCSLRIDFGNDFVPNPIETILNYIVFLLRREIEARTVNWLSFQSFLNFSLYFFLHSAQVSSLIFFQIWESSCIN